MLFVGLYASGKVALSISDEKCSNAKLVGGKAATLCLMKRCLSINIPDGFCITTDVYDKYLEFVGVDELINKLEHFVENEIEINKLSSEIRSRILNGRLDEKTIHAIQNQYNKLSVEGKDVLVAVRSSSTSEDMLNNSFAGQYESYLNNTGINQIIDCIKKVWASSYSVKVINYRNRNGLKHSDARMGVLIQRMVDAKSSGRAYSLDIETGASLISIKSILGLGEAEASGIASPDTWVLDKEKNIIKRRLGKKQFRIEYDYRSHANEVVENTGELQDQYAISCELAKELAAVVELIHTHFLKLKIKHVEIEYAITDDDQIFVTQARPETSWGSRGQVTFQAINKKMVGGENKVIFEGGRIGWGGVSFGVLRVLNSLEDAATRHKKGDVIVVGNTTNAWENIMVASSGLISQEDAISSHAVATTREESIPSVVGHPDAIKLLQKYDGQVVTLDATSRRVYLGVVPKESYYFPREIETVFEKLDSATEEKHWSDASCLGLTSVDDNGDRWLRRPVAGSGTFQHEINKKGFDWIANKADLPLIKRKRIKEGMLEILFSEAHKWREILRERDLNFFEKMYNERLKINDRYIKASLNLKYSVESVQEWIDASIEFYGIQQISFSFGKVTDGLLHNALAERKLKEPYLSQVRPATEAFYGRSLSKERVCFYNRLLATLKSNSKLYLSILDLSEGKQGAESFIKNNFSNFYKDIETYAKNYRITDTFSIDFAQPWFLKEVVKQLISDFDSYNNNDVLVESYSVGGEFFPDDSEFQRIARLAILAHKLKLDTHHIRCRGHWKFREFIAPFVGLLKRECVISEFSEAFDREPQWLVSQFEKFRDDVRLKQFGCEYDNGFKIQPYHSYLIGGI